ncbi:MAG: DNA polymerase III subunit epsilon [Parvularculaceae bacterium]|nr:DNA polymerase III subunit epsilon [Parvularculaceae bacterium]
MRQVVFDLETTGFRFDEGHRIVEIGGVEMVRGAVTGRSFHTYVNPERDMPEGAFKVHGLSEEFLRGHPVFADEKVARSFVDFVGDAELVAHNGVSFDLPFINAELENAGMTRLTNPIVDTLHLARRKFPGSPASLDALCSRFGIDTKEREREGHGALLDSRLLAEVYIELTGGLQAGLDFAVADAVTKTASSTGARQARVRPRPLPSLVTAEEAEAHARFVEGELGPASLWKTRA